MRSFVYFFWESNFYLLLFLAFYLIFLRNESHFRLNRFFLLLSMLISLLIPLIPLNNNSALELTGPVAMNAQSYWLPQVIVSAGKKTSSYLDWLTTTDLWTFLAAVYFIGLTTFFSIFIIQLAKLIKLILWKDTYRWNNCLVTESIEENYIFSFFNFIFIGNASYLLPSEKQKILEHEKVHVSQLHTLDLIFSNIIAIIFWFNPLIRIYKKKLIQQHEFEADSRAVEDNEVNDYCNLLARIALQSAGYPLANHFNNSLTIKRISIMQTNKKKIKSWKIAALIAFFPGVLFIASCQKQAMDEAEIKSSNSKETKEVFTVVEKLPEFPGGMEQWTKYATGNIAFPAKSRENGIEGIVYVSFEIDEKGNVTHPKIVKGLDPDCDKEALRVISQSPKWIPGEQKGVAVKASFTMPVKFTQSKDGKTKVTAKTNPLNHKFSVSFNKSSSNGKTIIEGTVLDKMGRPLEGAVIVQMGTTIGILTNKNGTFTIKPNSTLGELSISHVGYETKIIQF
ncbi:MAG TPA: TonB family protein [Cytophagales bacterium]|nr:TonB family protein [Cytophagales bacterium]